MNQTKILKYDENNNFCKWVFLYKSQFCNKKKKNDRVDSVYMLRHYNTMKYDW